MKVLLQYNSSSKVREITEPTEIFAVIEEAYDIQREKIFLQKYDEEFQEYVDLEDVSSIENKSKIKIINSAIASEAFVNNEQITENIAGPSACNYYHVENDPHVEVILNLKEQWPSVINLPFTDFSHPLTDALEKQLDLNWSCSSELVSHLATYAYQFKCYPTKQERLQICEALLCKYPYLKNDIGSGTGGWEAKLLNKLKKIRLNDTSLEIRLNRMKRKSLSSPIPKKLKLNPEKGEINWSPDHIEGETEIFQNLHKDIMTEESKKAVQFQDKSKLKSLMELMYSFRRYQINDNIPVAELIKEYPIFFQEEEQFEEFQRLTAVNLKETFFKEALSKGPKLFHVFRKNKSDHLKEIKKDIESMINILHESTTYDQETYFGLLVLPYLLKEEIKYFVEMVPCDVFESVCPKIFYIESFSSNRFFIVAENKCLVETKDIVDAVLAPKINISLISYLSDMIQDHHYLFKEDFPNINLKPKHHFLVHYPHLILKFGPLICCWSMRFEAKHLYFKRVAQNVKNSINLPFTLAKRHQQLQCYYNSECLRSVGKGDLFTNGKIVDVNSYPDEIAVLLANYQNYYSFKKVKINGISYKTGMYLVSGFDNDDPVFEKIMIILRSGTLTRFVCRTFTSSTVFHIRGFKIERSEGVKILSLDSFIDFYPLSLYKYESSMVIIPKYLLLNPQT